MEINSTRGYTASDFKDFNNAPENSLIRVSVNNGDIANAPNDLFNGEVITMSYPAYATQRALDYHGSRDTPFYYYRNYGALGWTPWKMLATAEIPTVYPLPLLSGISSTLDSGYYKTQESIVHLSFSCFKDSGQPWTNNELLFVLPVGFRPAHYCHGIAFYEALGGGTFQEGVFSVTTYGEVSATPNNGIISDAAIRINGRISFLTT